MSSTQSASVRSSSSGTGWVVALTGIGSMMGALDTVVVSTALSTIHSHLHASVAELEWTVNGYSLSFAVLLVAGAVLGDRFGRRRLYALGLILFAASSAACAVSTSISWLIAARVVQGAGAALLVPLSLTLLSAAFPPERRGAAIGIFSAITGVSVAAGPLVGGAVVQGLTWQWIFWLNVPIGVVAALLVRTKLAESYGPHTTLDIRGLALGDRSCLRDRVGAGAREQCGVEQPRGAGHPARRRPVRSGLHTLGAASGERDDAHTHVPVPRLFRRQCSHVLHVRLVVLSRLLLRSVPPSWAGL